MLIPNKVIFEEKSLNYDLGKELFQKFNKQGIDIVVNKTGRVTFDEKDYSKKYFKGKRTLVVGVKGDAKFQTCKPSAHYQLPIVSGCMGMCEYCYLNTQLGDRPYVKVFVDVEEILQKAFKYTTERLPDITIFEGAATSDPIPVEDYTGALAKCIEAFGENENTRFRFVTKYSEVDSLLNLKHNGHTTIRFSINTDYVIKSYEHGTDSVDKRIEAAKKVADAGYKLGFIIAPVFLYPGWKDEYGDIIKKLKDLFKDNNVEIEVISHRFTSRAKEKILKIFPNTKLPMDEESRTFKYGQFGYGKFTYTKEEMREIKEFFTERLIDAFGKEYIKYII